MALRPCKECGKEISTAAKICPHCGKRIGMSALGGCLLVFLLVLVSPILLLIIVKIVDSGGDSTPNTQTAVTQQPKDDAELLLSRCGKPDVDDSTAYDKPRPPIVTRWMEYRKARVKALFIADSALGAAPPYRWKFVGASDPRTQNPLEPKDAVKRLPCWRGK